MLPATAIRHGVNSGTVFSRCLRTGNTIHQRYGIDSLRSGAGSEYRIVNRGLPSGTALLVVTVSEDGEWAEIETQERHSWLDTHTAPPKNPPASLLINDLQGELEQVRSERDRVARQLNLSASEASEADKTISELVETLEATRTELTETKRVSAAALDLDSLNQQLVAELETERSDATCFA